MLDNEVKHIRSSQKDINCSRKRKNLHITKTRWKLSSIFADISKDSFPLMNHMTMKDTGLMLFVQLHIYNHDRNSSKMMKSYLKTILFTHKAIKYHEAMSTCCLNPHVQLKSKTQRWIKWPYDAVVLQIFKSLHSYFSFVIPHYDPSIQTKQP